MFQLEKGKETNRKHYQGRFELKCLRTGKKTIEGALRTEFSKTIYIVGRKIL